MKVISQLIDYFIFNGMLSTQDEEYLREKGYVKKYVSYNDEYELELREGEEEQESDEPFSELETGREKKISQKSRGSKFGKKQIKADEICDKIKNLLYDKLRWLSLSKPVTYSDDAKKNLIYLNNLPQDSLKKHIDTIFENPKSVWADFLFVMFEADFFGLCNNRCGIPVNAYKKAISGIRISELEKYKWILRWDEINMVNLLMQLKFKVLALLAENLENNHINLIKKLKAAKCNAGLISVVVFLYTNWYNKYLNTSNPELIYTTVPDGTIRDITISNDGKYIAFSATTGIVKVLKVDNKHEALLIEEIEKRVKPCFTFFNQTEKIAIASENAKKLQVFDLSDSKLESENSFSFPILALSVSPNDKLLLIKTTSELIIFDVETRRKKSVLNNLGIASCFNFIDDANIIMARFNKDFDIYSIRTFNYEADQYRLLFDDSYIENKFLSPLCHISQNRERVIYIEQGNNKHPKSFCKLKNIKNGNIKNVFIIDVDSCVIYSAAFSGCDDHVFLGCKGHVQCLNLLGEKIHVIRMENKNWAPSICCSPSTGVIFIDCDDKIYSVDYEGFINKFSNLKNLINSNKARNFSHLLAKFPVTTHPLAFYNSWLIYKQYHSFGFGEYLNMINETLIDQ